MRERINDFLQQFKALASNGKYTISADRKSYLTTIGYLGIEDADVKEVVLTLEPENYYEMPPNLDSDPCACVFGLTYDGVELYVKLVIRKKKQEAHIMSFHIPKRTVEYPLRDGCSEQENIS